MQEHVELEVSLEMIMAQIANEILNSNTGENNLEELMKLQEKAYSGDRQAIKTILDGRQ